MMNGTSHSAAVAGRHSTSRNSRSRPGSLHEAGSTQHSGSGRPYILVQSPVQQQDEHTAHQGHQQQQGDSAQPQPVCCSSSAKPHHDMSPGQIPRPRSRLEHHTDIHSSCHQQGPGSRSTSSHLVDSSVVGAGAGTGPSALTEQDNRQQGSRCVHSSMGYYRGDASQYRPTSCSASGNGLRSSRPGTGRSGSAKQQQQQQHIMASGSSRNNSLTGSYGMGPFTAQHYASTATANPLYANSSAAALLCKASSSGSRYAGNRNSPVATPRKSVAGYAAGQAAVAASTHSTGGSDPSASNTVQLVDSTRCGTSSSRPAGGIRDSGTLCNDNMHSPRALGSTAVNLKQQKQQLGATSSQTTNTHMHSRQGYRSTSGILRTSSSGGSRQQQANGICKPQPGVLSQDPAPSCNILAATYLGCGSSNSRPSSASGQQGPSAPVCGQAGAAGELRCPSRLQQQKPPQQSAFSTTPVSVLATPRSSSSRPQSRSMRPHSAAKGRPRTTASQGQQLNAGSAKQVAQAAGPLLSEYFRPPSAAAPGCVGLFGLPGMEPPGGLASAIPCVKVPSVHASWDAAVAGLALSHSNSVETPSTAATVVATPCSSVGQQQQPAAARQQAQAQYRPVTQPGPVRLSTGGSTLKPGCARPGSSSRAQRPGTVGCLAAGTSDASKQQLLLWSAAHEIDGRPVTRNGERARLQSAEAGS